MDAYADLEHQLEAACFEACRRTVAAQAHEDLYCIALFTSSGYEYVYDTANSATGLEGLVEAGLAQGHYTDRAEASKAYRWSPCDWPHHLDHEDLFQGPNELLETLWRSLDGAPQEDSDRAYIAIHGVFVSVLRKLRHSGLVPEGCLLMLLAGDQSDEARVVNAEAINPPALVAAFLSDVDLDAAHLARLRADRWPRDGFFEP
jgi:hypothetical protein